MATSRLVFTSPTSTAFLQELLHFETVKIKIIKPIYGLTVVGMELLLSIGKDSMPKSFHLVN